MLAGVVESRAKRRIGRNSHLGAVGMVPSGVEWRDRGRLGVIWFFTGGLSLLELDWLDVPQGYVRVAGFRSVPQFIVTEILNTSNLLANDAERTAARALLEHRANNSHALPQLPPALSQPAKSTLVPLEFLK